MRTPKTLLADNHTVRNLPKSGSSLRTHCVVFYPLARRVMFLSSLRSCLEAILSLTQGIPPLKLRCELKHQKTFIVSNHPKRDKKSPSTAPPELLSRLRLPKLDKSQFPCYINLHPYFHLHLSLQSA